MVLGLVGRIVAVVLLGTATASGGGPARLAVVVQVGSTEATLHRERATLRCVGAVARGTGYLAGPRRAARACRAVRAGHVGHVAREQGPQRMCPMIYGGPQTARIRGVIAGARVRLMVTRSDGCGVGDWRQLEALLGDPERDSTRLTSTET